MLTVEQEEWLTALESGNYKQAIGYLEKAGAYCCLGVACSLDSTVTRELIGDIGVYDSEEDCLPDHVYERLGLNDSTGGFDPALVKEEYQERIWGLDEYALSVMNDAGWIFSEIAAFIRANPGAVFNA